MIKVPYLLDSVGSGLGFIVYAGVTLWTSLRDENKAGKSERWSRKNPTKRPKPQPRSALFWIHIFGNLVVFSLCISHAILLAKGRHDRLAMRADPDVGAILFGSLLWLVFFLGMTDGTKSAGVEQYVPWMISLVSYGLSSAANTASTAKHTWDIIVQWVRLLVVLALIFSVVLGRKKAGTSSKEKELAIEETQPLLENTEVDTSNKTTQAEAEDDWEDDDDRSVKSYASDDDDQEEAKENENDAKKEEKKQQKALRDRPWHEYIASFAIFIPYVRPRTRRQHFYLTIMVINTIVARGINLGQPLMLGAVIDDLAHRRLVLWRIFAYVGLRFAASSSGTALIRNIASFRLNIELHNTLLIRCFSHIMDLDATYHMSKNTPATWQIMERGQSVINLLQSICFDHLPVLADLVIALFVVSHLFGAYLCFAVATTMVLLSWSNRITLSKKTSMRRHYVDLWRNWYSHMTESLQFWRTVSEFNKIAHEKQRHSDKTAAYTKVSMRQQSFRNYLSAVQQVVVTLGFLFVCVIASMEIVAGRLDVSRFVVLITYWSQIMSPVTAIAGFASDIAEELVDAEKLLLLLEKKPKVVSQPNAPKFVFKGGHVKFENCDFSYDGERVVTKQVSFEAKPGQTVAFVGETGGGKSTIFNLLYRFYDPRNGRVFVDGQDISQVDLQSYRSQLGLVPQDTVLFNTSIIKNIRYGNLDATKAQVTEACKAAQFHDKVMKFPKKYKQKVGELAQKLSGGEKQRLAIARAILKDPGILLLDEATSAVDSVTETKIQESLQQLSHGRTTFVIAHRLSTIMDADCILVVKNGEIVESGTHEAMLSHGNGAYKELWDAQLKLASGKGKQNKAENAGAEASSSRSSTVIGDGSDKKDDKDEEEAAAQDKDGEASPSISQDVTPVNNSSDEAEADQNANKAKKESEQDGSTTSSNSSGGDRSKRTYGTL